MGRNAWDTTPEEEPEVEESILYVDGIEYTRVPIQVDVEVEVPPENVTENLRRRVERLQEEQREGLYLYTRELQIRELIKEIEYRKIWEASDG